MIRWVIDMSSWSSELEWVCLTHTTPHVVKQIRIVTKTTNYILVTLSTENTQQAFTHASRTFSLYVFNASEKITSTTYIIDCALSEEIKST